MGASVRNDTGQRAKLQVTGLVDLGCHYANTPTVIAPSILLPRYSGIQSSNSIVAVKRPVA